MKNIDENNEKHENVTKYSTIVALIRKNSICIILLVLFIWKLSMILIITGIAYSNEIPLITTCAPEWEAEVFNSTITPFLNLFGSRWDCFHYLRIAANGYSAHEATYAFSPLYPLFISIFSLNGELDYVLSAVLVANLFSFCAVTIFYYICKMYQLTEKQSFSATLIFAFFPTFLIYTTVAYAESTFLVFSLLAWYFFEKYRRNQDDKTTKILFLLTSTVLTGLSALARYPAVLLFGIFPIIIVIEFFLKKNFEKESVFELFYSITISLVGALFPLVWLLHCQDIGIDILTIQIKYWGQELVLLGGIINWWRGIPYPFFELYSFVLFILFFSIVGGIKRHWGLLLQALPFFVFYSSITGLGSWAVVRYSSTIWPAYIGWGSSNKDLLPSVGLALFFMMWGAYNLIRFCFCMFWG